MTLHKNSIAFCVMLVVCLLDARFALAASAEKLVRDGNKALSAGKFEEALRAYEKASVDVPEAPEIYFNKASVEFARKNYPKAAELFETAAVKSTVLEFEAKSKYNQGNCLFRESERQRDSDLQKSLTALETAIRHYQQALKLNPALVDAAHNIEVARLTMKQILDEIQKKKKEEEKKQQKQKQLRKSLEDLIKRQKSLREENETLTSEQFADQATTLSNLQQQLQTETEDLAEKINSSGDPTFEGAKAPLEEAVTHQKEAAKSLDQLQQPDATDEQRNAEKKLREALDSSSRESQKQKNKQQSNQSKQQKNQGKQQKNASKQETNEQKQKAPPQQQASAAARNEKAKDILNEERANRENRQRHSTQGSRSVDKDW